MDVYYELEAEKLINAGENVSNLQYIHPKHTMGHIYKAANLTFTKTFITGRGVLMVHVFNISVIGSPPVNLW